MQQIVPIVCCPDAISGLDLARALVDNPEPEHYWFVLSLDSSGNLKVHELVILVMFGQAGELAFFVPDGLKVQGARMTRGIDFRTDPDQMVVARDTFQLAVELAGRQHRKIARG